jgi:hypothetical protein
MKLGFSCNGEAICKPQTKVRLAILYAKSGIRLFEDALQSPLTESTLLSCSQLMSRNRVLQVADVQLLANEV